MPTGPGLGIEVDEEKVKAGRTCRRMGQPLQYQQEDGSYGDW